MDDLWSHLNRFLTLKSINSPASPFIPSPRAQHQQLPQPQPQAQSALKNFECSPSLSSIDHERLGNGIPFVPSTNLHQFQSIHNHNNIDKLNQSYHHFQMQHIHHHLSAFQPVPLSISPPQMHQLVNSHPVHQSYQRHDQMHPRPLATTSTDSSVQGEKVVAAAAAQLETIVSNMGTSKQGHICIYCGKLYSRKYGLKIHIRTHTGFKPLKCKYCLRPFGDPSNLNKHIRLHVQEKSLYKCHLCSKILVRRRDLLRHMNIKHNIIESTNSDTRSNNGDCDNNSNDNLTIRSVNEFNGTTSSSRSNSVNSDVGCDLTSNDDDEDYDVRVDVD